MKPASKSKSKVKRNQHIPSVGQPPVATSAKNRTPTVTAKTKPESTPISHVRVLINDTEEVDVDSRAAQAIYFDFARSAPLNDSAFKCSGCGMVTVHEGYELWLTSLDTTVEDSAKRVYLCTNCGKTSLK